MISPPKISINYGWGSGANLDIEAAFFEMLTLVD